MRFLISLWLSLFIVSESIAMLSEANLQEEGRQENIQVFSRLHPWGEEQIADVTSLWLPDPSQNNALPYLEPIHGVYVYVVSLDSGEHKKLIMTASVQARGTLLNFYTGDEDFFGWLAKIVVDYQPTPVFSNPSSNRALVQIFNGRINLMEMCIDGFFITRGAPIEEEQARLQRERLGELDRIPPEDAAYPFVQAIKQRLLVLVRLFAEGQVLNVADFLHERDIL